MRSKQEILASSLTTDSHGTPIPQFTAQQSLLQLEVLIDIRDVLNERLLEIDRGIHALLDI